MVTKVRQSLIYFKQPIINVSLTGISTKQIHRPCYERTQMEEDQLLFYQFELFCLVLGLVSILCAQQCKSKNKTLFEKLQNNESQIRRSNEMLSLFSTISKRKERKKYCPIYPSHGCFFSEDDESLKLFPLHDIFNVVKDTDCSGSTSSLSTGSSTDSRNFDGVLKGNASQQVVIVRGDEE